MKRLAVSTLAIASSIFMPLHANAEASTSLAPMASAGGHTTLIIFLLIVALSLHITYRAAKKTKTASDFFSAGGKITGLQNGLASAGEHLSAAGLLGLVSSVYVGGYDGLVFSIGWLVGWPMVLFLMAERARNLGKYTLVDIVTYRLKSRGIRVVISISSLLTVFFYLTAQMVGAGELLQVIVGVNYGLAVSIVGILIVIYVSLGGMHATTWVQIVKAVIMIGAGTLLFFLSVSRFGFSFSGMLTSAVDSSQFGKAILGPGKMFSNPIATLSLSLTLIFGLSGMPHILMRFFTVPNVVEARKSAFVALTCIGYMFLAMTALGFASIVIVGKIAKPNMVAIYLAKAVGGDVLEGLFAAMLFASILAVAAGLLLAGASAVAHDMYANMFKKAGSSAESEITVTRIATVLIGGTAVGLSMLFKGQSLIFLVIIPGSIAVSAVFPLLFLSMYWRGLTSRGALWSCIVGLVSSVTLQLLGPSVWVTALGNSAPVFPYDYPALFSMPLTFAVAFAISVFDKSYSATEERKAFTAQYVVAQTGVFREERSGLTQHRDDVRVAPADM